MSLVCTFKKFLLILYQLLVYRNSLTSIPYKFTSKFLKFKVTWTWKYRSTSLCNSYRDRITLFIEVTGTRPSYLPKKFFFFKYLVTHFKFSTKFKSYAECPRLKAFIFILYVLILSTIAAWHISTILKLHYKSSLVRIGW